MLAVSFVVTAVCVFFLGFYVGKKNAALHAPQEDRVARIPVDDFSKYARPAVPAGASVEAAGADKTSQAKADDEADAKAVAVAKAEVAAPDDAKAERKVRKGQEAETPMADDAADDQEPAVPAKARKKADAAVEEPAEEARDDAEEDAEDGQARAPGYTVQVLATRKEADAEALIKKLKARGYEAYVKRVSDGQTSWYRVRVGRYGGFGDARAMADRCRRELGLEQAFVSTE